MAALSRVIGWTAHRRTSVSLLVLFGAILWKWYSMLALDSLGLIKPLFNMELVTGFEKMQAINAAAGDYNHCDIQFLFQMDAPDNLEEFNEHLR